jgi:uracil phosphoribosyltransferase/uridine kinase/adenylate cyclase class IV
MEPKLSTYPEVERREREPVREVGFQEGVEAMTEEILTLGQRQGVVVQSLAAESASGKGYLFGQVGKRLEAAGIPADQTVTLSTDNYYKGISRMTLERVARSRNMAGLDSPEKVAALREVIGNRFFSFKFGNGFREDGSEVSDRAVMGELYDKWVTGASLTGEEAARAEWALRFVHRVEDPELAGWNFNAPASLDTGKLAAVLERHQLDRESFLAAFSEQGVQEQIRERLEFSPEAWEAVQPEFSTDPLNFDEPAAVDLERLRRDLETLKAGGQVAIPEYSMKVSESTGSSLSSTHPRVVLLEGLYALHDAVADQADRKAFLHSDRVYQIVRRFCRDFILEKRSSFTPELQLFIMTHIVYPEANRHVLPDKEKAELIITNDLTDQEDALFREVISEKVQCKHQLNKAQAAALTRKLERRFSREPEVITQEDVYVADEEKGSDRLLRVRVENGALQSVQYQGKPFVSEGGAVSRPFVTLCEGPFAFPYADGELPLYPGSRTGYEKLLADLTASGFHISNVVAKERKVYREGNITINLDTVDGLGTFVEVRTDEGADEEALRQLVSEFGIRLDAGRTVDSYFDLKNERDLNEGIRPEDVAGVYESLESDEKMRSAFATLRQGYPDLPYAEQTHGAAFREAAAGITRAIAQKTLEVLPPEAVGKVVVVLPWRSALAFVDPYAERGAGFYHLSSKRNEVTLKTEVDFTEGEIPEGAYVVIADPMLATGNTMLDAIERVKALGVPEERIVLNSVVAAPVGVFKAIERYPDIQIVVGALDQKLNKFGYIVPGLGDFGDKYFDELEAEPYVAGLIRRGIVSVTAGERLLNRLRVQAGGESPLKEEEQREGQEDAAGGETVGSETTGSEVVEIETVGSEAGKATVGRESASEGMEDGEMAELRERPAYRLIATYLARHPEYDQKTVREIVEDIEQHEGHELERKYRIAKPDIEPYLEKAVAQQITQGYFPPARWGEALEAAGLNLSDWEGAPLAEVRVRQTDGECTVTAKSERLADGVRRESERTVTDPDTIRRILAAAEAGTVRKERFSLPIDWDGVPLTVEADRYLAVGPGGETETARYPYVILEVELPGAFLAPLLAERGKEFAPFLAAAEDVTGRPEYDNRELALHGFPEQG